MDTRIALPISLLFLSTATFANQPSFGIVGGSATFGESVFSIKENPKLGATPNLFYSGSHGFIDGSLANWQALPYVGLSANWRFAEVSDTFADLPVGIESRDGNGELGITLGTVGARLTYLHDVTSVHNGYEIQLHLGRTLETGLPSLTLTPYFEADYRDKKLSRHLYNVSTQEAATSGLSAFESDSTFVYQTGLIGLYEFTPRWIGISKVELVHHDSDSALIQRDLGWSVEVGLTYRFAGL